MMRGAAAAPPLSPDLEVVKKSKGPVITVLEEFYKVGPGPSSSHTIGPMRITYDFYQRCTKLPPDQLAQATGIKVHLFGSLSATGVGHGTERAALAGVIGKGPQPSSPNSWTASCPIRVRAFREVGRQHLQPHVEGRHLQSAEGGFPAPQHDDVPVDGRERRSLRALVLLGRRRLYRVEGISTPEEGTAELPVLDHEGVAGARGGERAVNRAGGDGQRDRRLWKERGGGQRLHRHHPHGDGEHRQGRVDSTARHPARSHQAQDQSGRSLRAGEGRPVRGAARDGAGVGLRAGGIGRNARGHLVVTAPTGGLAGVLPALVYSLGEGGRNLPQQKIRDGFLAAASIGYLCKHNATLSGAEGGCQAEIGVASAMGAAFISQAYDFAPQVVANAAEAALQHHLGMTCDPVAGYVQLPCIERCAFGAIKAYAGFVIAINRSRRTGVSNSTRPLLPWRSRPRR